MALGLLQKAALRGTSRRAHQCAPFRQRQVQQTGGGLFDGEQRVLRHVGLLLARAQRAAPRRERRTPENRRVNRLPRENESSDFGRNCVIRIVLAQSVPGFSTKETRRPAIALDHP